MRPLTIWLFLPLVQGLNLDPIRDQEGKGPPQDDSDFVPGADVGGSAPKPYLVPFGHIFKEGIDDPFSDTKQPVDLLELYLRAPRSRAESERLLKEVPKERIYRIKKGRYDTYRGDLEDRVVEKERPRKKDDPNWFDFEAIHAEKLANPNRPIPTPDRKTSSSVWSPPQVLPPIKTKSPGKNLTWTTCEEFSKGSSSFHPKDIVDIDWTPFYIWSPRRIWAAVVHKFTYPTKKIVKKYKSQYAHLLLNKKLDWEQPKLVLNESIEMLLIADPKDRRGLFHGVPKRPVPTDRKTLKLVQFTVPRIRVKIHDPYLALMHCDEYFAAIMASPGNEPANDQERIEEASTLNFTGNGFPVQRDLEAEEASRRAIAEQQRIMNEVKLIKAVDVDAIRVDMD